MRYPIGAEHYMLYEEIGHGLNASVYRAICIPNNDVVAIKIIDFESGNCNLNNISHEAQTMILVDHPNVLRSHCSFVNGHNLWVVTPFMAGGSCLHILKAAYPEGFEEVVIATILREVLKALEYLHSHGHIHRDVKAGNILIDASGAIKLGDFGVSACLYDSGDRKRMRNTFVGTPCWMAPEVMEQVNGYDFKADIWSFGITALELAHGHAPFSKYPPTKVLLMTLQNAPPGLDYERDKKFSRSFKQMIASCLVKNPSQRPSAQKLLKHSFFKQAKSNNFIARKLLENLPALGDLVQALMKKEEDMILVQRLQEMSQNEYKRGISEWNFNLEDMKAQASLIQDEDSISDKYEKSEDDVSITSSTDGHRISQDFSPHAVNCDEIDLAGQRHLEINGNPSDGIASYSHQRETSPGSFVPEDSEKMQSQFSKVLSCNECKPPQTADNMTSGSRCEASITSVSSDEQDEKGKSPGVQQKGRFRITSESVDTEKPEAANDKDKELLHEITDLQLRLVSAKEELQKRKSQRAQV